MNKVLYKKVYQSLLVMAEIIEAKDPYTGGHLWRVSQYSRRLAAKAGFDHRQIVTAAIGGFLHDLGKIGVPDAILQKKGKLTYDEYEIIKTHPKLGAELVREHPLADLVRDAIELHHEMPNGRGYPYGKKDEEIPWVAKIVGITDAFDAMTSTRPYRAGMPIEKALSILSEGRGGQFDADLVDHFIALAEDHQLDDIIGHSDAGIPLLNCLVCGPTLHIHRDNHAGDYIYCRSCTGEFKLQQDAGDYSVMPTMQLGDADRLRPTADLAVINDLVEETLATLL